MRFIGDVHGKFSDYLALIQDGPPSIQIGDFGFGLTAPGHIAPPIAQMLARGDRCFRGNHDNPHIAAASPVIIPPGGLVEGVFCLGGAMSVDRHLREPGVDWWLDEELSMTELYAAMDLYEAAKPDCVATHDCPASIADAFLLRGYDSDTRHSRTRQALDSLLYIHAPQLWVFGHWHRPLDVVVGATRFVCLPELNVLDV